MQPGLEGRRIAVVARRDARVVREALAGAGAVVEQLPGEGNAPAPEAWHSGRFAALVIADSAAGDQRAVQLVRECLLASKPIATFADGMRLVEAAGGTAEDVVNAGASDTGAFAAGLAAALAEKLDQDQVDESSDLSFPASDPPAVSPAPTPTAPRGPDPRP